MRDGVQYSHMRKPRVRWGIKFEVTVQGILWVAFTVLAIKIGFIAKAGSDEFLIEITPFMSLMIACVAANATINALRKTRESLELTRQSQRPFLSVVEWEVLPPQKGITDVRLHIHNSGILPANNMRAELDFFAKDESVNKENYSNTYVASKRVGHNQTVIFPNTSVTSVTHLDKEDIDDKQILSDLGNGCIKFRATIKYRSCISGHCIDHITWVTGELRESRTGLFSISPQDWT